MDTPPPPPPSPPPPPPVLNVLGWAWIALGILLPVSGLLALAWVLIKGDPTTREQSGHIVLGLLALPSIPAGLLSGALAIAAGVGLRRRRPWAVGLALVLPALALALVAFVALTWPNAFWFVVFLYPGPLLISALGLVTVPVLLASVGAFRGPA